MYDFWLKTFMSFKRKLKEMLPSDASFIDSMDEKFIKRRLKKLKPNPDMSLELKLDHKKT